MCSHAWLPESTVERMSDADPSEKLVSLSVRVPADLRRQLRLHALEHGLSAQDCVKQALTVWLDAQAPDRTPA